MIDVIGDVEGCYIELLELLEKLGYELTMSDDVLPVISVSAPALRPSNLIVFVGDLVNPGPHPDLVLNIVIQLSHLNLAIVVKGNHDDKYLRYLNGENLTEDPFMQAVAASVAAHGREFEARVKDFLQNLCNVFETEDVIVVHAAYRQNLEDDADGAALVFVYGEANGNGSLSGAACGTDAGGRTSWISDYTGHKTIVHRHNAVDQVETTCTANGASIWNIDTKAAYGMHLTALRLPSCDIAQAQAKAAYAEWLD